MSSFQHQPLIMTPSDDSPTPNHCDHQHLSGEHPPPFQPFHLTAFLPMKTTSFVPGSAVIQLSADTPTSSSSIAIPKRRRNSLQTGGRPSLNSHLSKHFSRDKNGGLRLVDSDALDKQKGILFDLLKQAGKSLLDGQGIASISLPVRVFTSETLLEMFARAFGYAPELLSRAALLNLDVLIQPNEDISDNNNNQSNGINKKGPPLAIAIERMKLVMAFAISSLHLLCSPLKPFNPILGETFSARFFDGTALYFESTSHHPLIFHFHVDGPNHSYTYSGHVESCASIGSGNTASLSFKGNHVIDFHDDGQKIAWTLPTAELSGILWGSRVYDWKGPIEFKDAQNSMSGVIDLSKTKKSPTERGYYESHYDWFDCSISCDEDAALSFVREGDRNILNENSSFVSSSSMVRTKTSLEMRPKCDSQLTVEEEGGDDSMEVESCVGFERSREEKNKEEEKVLNINEENDEVKMENNESSVEGKTSKEGWTSAVSKSKFRKTLRRVWGLGSSQQRKSSLTHNEEGLSSEHHDGRSIQRQSSSTFAFRKKSGHHTSNPSSVDVIHSGKKNQRVPLCEGEGCWLECLLFDQYCYWDIHTTPFAPLEINGMIDALPSDSRYRRDVNLFRDGVNFNNSQHWKELLEARQRQDRSARAAERTAIGAPHPYCT